MKKRNTYRHLIFLLFSLQLVGCSRNFDERVTLWRNDKIPYGTYYAYHNLEYIFRDATIETNSKSPTTFYEQEYHGAAYIIIATSVEPDEKELKAILNFASSGNQVFISAVTLGDNLLDSFRLHASNYDNLYNDIDSLKLSIYDPASNDSLAFVYPGKAMDNTFTKFDTSITNIMGRDVDGDVNFVKFTYEGGGAVYLNLAPAAFTNFFLLHKNNKKYYDLALSSIPDTINTVKWDDYYRRHHYGQANEKSSFSKIGAFLKNRMLRWAFWLTILLFTIIYLFESKRKQRLVPVVKGLKNSSLDFVKTVGRLYYQRKDNKNLASKMATHFLAHVRNRYNLQTSNLDEQFEKMLAFKSGADKSSITNIIQYIRVIDEQTAVTDDALLSFNENIENFYKQT